MRLIIIKAGDAHFRNFGFNMSGYALVDSSLKKTILLQTLAIFTSILFPNMLSIYVDFSKVNIDLVQLIATAAIQKEIRTSGLSVDLVLKSLQQQGYSVAFFGDNACSTTPEIWDDFYSMITDTRTFIALADSSKELIQNDYELKKGSKQKTALNLSKIRPIVAENIWRS